MNGKYVAFHIFHSVHWLSFNYLMVFFHLTKKKTHTSFIINSSETHSLSIFCEENTSILSSKCFGRVRLFVWFCCRLETFGMDNKTWRIKVQHFRFYLYLLTFGSDTQYSIRNCHYLKQTIFFFRWAKNIVIDGLKMHEHEYSNTFYFAAIPFAGLTNLLHSSFCFPRLSNTLSSACFGCLFWPVIPFNLLFSR